MRTSTVARKKVFRLKIDAEVEFVARLVDMSMSIGLRIAPDMLINLYIALKAKPLALVVGPVNTGKQELTKLLATRLTEMIPIRYQRLSGRPAREEDSLAESDLLTMQARFNTTKILALIEEACHPENLTSVYALQLAHLSPADLREYFFCLASQTQHGEIQRLPTIELPFPLPFPPNLLVIGTLDSPPFLRINDELLLSQTTIIQLSAQTSTAASLPRTRSAIGYDKSCFLQSCIRNIAAARKRLQTLPGWDSQALKPLLESESLLLKHDLPLSTGVVTNEALIYLANAWSSEGMGLFSPDFNRNLTIALDLAIAQSVLPRAWMVISYSPKLRFDLEDFLKDDFPHARRVLETWSAHI